MKRVLPVRASFRPRASRRHSGRPADFCGQGIDPWPTSAAPGSWQKVEVLVLRATLGHALFSPGDALADSAAACSPSLIAY